MNRGLYVQDVVVIFEYVLLVQSQIAALAGSRNIAVKTRRVGIAQRYPFLISSYFIILIYEKIFFYLVFDARFYG